MSQCYLGSESKTSMTKLYFEVFIANYFYTFNKKDPVYTEQALDCHPKTHVIIQKERQEAWHCHPETQVII